MRRVRGRVQHYDWGERTFIPQLLGLEADGRPWAELWLGTHPSGPSEFDDGSPLDAVAGRLPYLLKVLACAEPLSLQTHPSAEQARAGFERGVFADPSPKPELLCALTRFEAFSGVRPITATLALLEDLGADHLARVLAADGPRAALSGLFRGTIDAGAVIRSCDHSTRVEADWVRRLAARYPGEPAVAATLLLNHLVLEPGDAIGLGPGNIHAYLHGVGVELMAASDNVVRGGLTTKPVDVELFLEIADPTPLGSPVLPGGDRFDLPDAGVALVRLAPGATHVATGHELSVDLLGNTWYLAPGDQLTTDDSTYVVVPSSNPGH